MMCVAVAFVAFRNNRTRFQKRPTAVAILTSVPETPLADPQIGTPGLLPQPTRSDQSPEVAAASSWLLQNPATLMHIYNLHWPYGIQNKSAPQLKNWHKPLIWPGQTTRNFF